MLFLELQEMLHCPTIAMGISTPSLDHFIAVGVQLSVAYPPQFPQFDFVCSTLLLFGFV